MIYIMYINTLFPRAIRDLSLQPKWEGYISSLPSGQYIPELAIWKLSGCPNHLKNKKKKKSLAGDDEQISCRKYFTKYKIAYILCTTDTSKSCALWGKKGSFSHQNKIIQKLLQPFLCRFGGGRGGGK